MIAVATTAERLDQTVGELRSLGLAVEAVHAPTERRRVVVTDVPTGVAAGPLVARLRADGALAVARPAGGAALRAWQRDTAPVVIAGQVTVAPAWSEHDRATLPGLIELGPGGFGSGHHPTTRMLVEELVERIQGRERILDVGCGSGVLALSALSLGARHAVAVDLKPEAVAATRRNAVLNGLVGLDATTTPLAEIDGRFDVVVANIARDGVVTLASELVGAVGPRGWLAVSGITPQQCDQVASFLQPLTETRRHVESDWAMMVFAH